MPDLYLKTHSSMSFKKKEVRDQFVKFVSELVNAGRGPFVPEQLNKGSTDLEWCVDQGNDIWLFFEAGDHSLVRIKHRYDVKPALMALGGWIAYRWRMTVVTPELALPLAEAE